LGYGYYLFADGKGALSILLPWLIGMCAEYGPGVYPFAMGAHFGIAAFEDAIKKYGKPAIMNTD